ncbi:DUF2786 domain-containing protein [Streptomyces kanamyceticus]|uniref:DUF2786 domain-containing protein n=1 Tax=Streptomyces kanamyceticus TaxID=1967 RepID=Q1EQK7_STRKN|nr:DUF2786 domain-containing protein [Streptomyces kanamyceticus]QEU90548.1 DUF2786 domain-containing protein [Streptomyces kanamyceticus]BAE95513.1 hypothetical protein [Streptomyces kanamyceticus]
MNETKVPAKLETIRALLAKAEDPRTPESEAELARKRAFEMMAKYGVEQAMLNDAKPGSDAPTDRQIVLDNPWAMERVRLVNRIALALGCKLIHLGRDGGGPGRRVHIFGYASDLERVELLYTSLLLQMNGGLAAQSVPGGQGARAWRRSWLLGFINRIGDRIEQAERGARDEARAETAATGRSAALVLADRKTVVSRNYQQAYPRSRKGGTTTVTGNGYGAGWVAGSRADIGGKRIGRSTAGSISA